MMLGLRQSRVLLADAMTTAANAANMKVSAQAAAAAGEATTAKPATRVPSSFDPTSKFSQREKKPFIVRKTLTDRFDSAGYPFPKLNQRYASLVVGQHFSRVVFDKRSEMMAILSATNLIREVIANEGRVLITSTDKRLQPDLLASARDSGEFTHFGKWPPGGFTNRVQVAAVPQLPSLVIALESDNHVLMREAFQMCIPRVAPVDVYNARADFKPEVPLHAAELSLIDKRRLLTFFTSFIAKLKFGQMPVGDTQGRYKEYAEKMLESYHQLVRDAPEPYLAASKRPYDNRPDLAYGVKPEHLAYNEKRAFEESSLFKAGALQSQDYKDPAMSNDDILAENPPPIDQWNLKNTVEYQTMTELSTPDIDSTMGHYIRDVNTGRLIPEMNQRDYEHEEYTADLRARSEAGLDAPKFEFQTRQEKQDKYDAEAAVLDSTPNDEVREMYEEWYKDRQDAENDFIPYARDTQAPLKSHWTTPGEPEVQSRLWKLKNRVREAHANAEVNAAEEKKERKRTIRMNRMPRSGDRTSKSFGFATGSNNVRSFSTSAAPASSSSSSSSPSSSSSTTQSSKFRFPRFLLPLFLLVPAGAYLAAEMHAPEEERQRVRENQKEIVTEMKEWLQGAPLNQKLTAAETSALKLELDAKTSRLNLLLQARSHILSTIPKEDLVNHKAVLDEVEVTKEKLEKEIKDIQQKLN